MAVSITVNRVVFEPGQGRVLVSFSDGTGFEFRSKADLQARITAIDPADFAKQVALAMWVQRGITDGTELVGRTVSMDLSKNAFGVIS